MSKGRRRGRVLIVDGEYGRWLQHFLSHDHDVEVESRGDDVIRLIDGGACFDVILCDVIMPDCTGPELCAKLAERHPEQAMNLVLITDGVMPERARDAIAKMPNLCIRRPFDAEGMRALVWRRMGLGLRGVGTSDPNGRFPSASSNRSTNDREARRRDEALDEASDESFPASDPPSYTAVHAGPPCR
jgi:CheY-like chemotaxis protein